MSRFLASLARRGTLVLDGALATELERRGADLDHPLWSARCLLETPELLTDVHRAYMRAGADVITTAGYQASVRGFEALGLDRVEAERCYRSSIQLAASAVDEHVRSRALSVDDRPLVAASVGPYGAFLADGSEYRGGYAATDAELAAFHREQLRLVAHAWSERRVDIVACETVPSVREARVLAEAVTELGLQAWIAFSCRNASETSEGQDVADAARALDDFEGVVALGFNCTAPEYAPGLLARLADATDLPLVAYPNSGESYDVERRGWRGTPSASTEPSAWWDAGASLLGGCCRTGPDDVAAIRAWRDART